MARHRKKQPTTPQPRSTTADPAASSSRPLQQQAPDQSPSSSFIEKHFLLLALLIGLIFVGINCYRINRPFNGLHSWGAASGAWAARSHLNYGLGYTKGLKTLVVGYPPPENPNHYLSHPQLGSLISAGFMAITGTEHWAMRIPGIIIGFIGLLLFMLVFRKIFPPDTVLLTALFIAMFPLTAYFGSMGLSSILYILAIYRYLILIGQIPHQARPRWTYLIEIVVYLFLLNLLSWNNVFYCFAFFLHYLSFCILKKTRLQWPLLAVIILAPLASVGTNFLVMTIGYGQLNAPAAQQTTTDNAATDALQETSPQKSWWQKGMDKIVSLYKWRQAKGERKSFDWHAWFTKVNEHARSNFTLPVLLLLLFYFIARILRRLILIFRSQPPAKRPPTSTDQTSAPDRAFHLWIFWLIPPVLFQLVLKGLVWEHEYWQRSFIFVVAIGSASGLLLFTDALRRWLNPFLARLACTLLIILAAGACARGIHAYHSVQWQSPQTIALFQKLHDMIPPENDLLTFKDFFIQQHPSKPGFYRPEYAWYLDRNMIVAQSPDDIAEKMQTGRFRYYFIPDTPQPIGGAFVPPDLRRQLRQLDTQTLVQNLMDQSVPVRNRQLYDWELRERRRLALIEWLKARYPYEYYGTPGQSGPRGNIPCYIFDLKNPLQS